MRRCFLMEFIANGEPILRLPEMNLNIIEIQITYLHLLNAKMQTKHFEALPFCVSKNIYWMCVCVCVYHKLKFSCLWWTKNAAEITFLHFRYVLSHYVFVWLWYQDKLCLHWEACVSVNNILFKYYANVSHKRTKKRLRNERVANHLAMKARSTK